MVAEWERSAKSRRKNRKKSRSSHKTGQIEMKSDIKKIENAWLWSFSDGSVVAFDGVTLVIVLPREDFSLVSRLENGSV
jgi:hypothetical protein